MGTTLPDYAFNPEDVTLNETLMDDDAVDKDEVIRKLIAALLLYADPDTYFATTIYADPPAGAIDEDWSTHEGFLGREYDPDDQRPGRVARDTLTEISEYFTVLL